MRDKIIEGNYETGLMAGILLKLHGLVVYAPAGIQSVGASMAARLKGNVDLPDRFPNGDAGLLGYGPPR